MPDPTRMDIRPMVQQRLQEILSPLPGPSAFADYRAQRVAELRAMAASAPVGLQDIATEFHARAGAMEQFGLHETAAALHLQGKLWSTV